MIRYLFGQVTLKELDEVVVDVGGVGYGVKITLGDHESLQLGAKVKLFIHEHIKDDAYDLFGFVNSGTITLFKQLLSVKNVGPKVAMAILGLGSEQSVRQAIS